MSRLRRETKQRKLLAENAMLRAKLFAAHDHLHNNRLNELHEVLHCSSCDEAATALSEATPLPGQNVSIDSAGRLAAFMPEFNRLCAKHRINACCVAHVPSATKAGYVSIQLGGSVDVINWVRREMGMKDTLAVGDH